MIHETDQLELKAIFVPEVKKDIVAFANSAGGTVYISVSKESDGDNYEDNRSLIQELTFTDAKKELAARNIEFGKVQQKNLGVLTGDGLYTNLGLLLSDQCKHTVKIAVFQGTDKLVFRDRKEFSGSLFRQLEDVYNAIDFYNGTKATFQRYIRSDERDYPPDAIREALLNAIIHRDYGFSGSTIINVYTDRIEMISLGGLVSGLSLEAVMMGASQPRNERLAALFYRMRLIEAYGTGIGKIISSYSGFARQPVFENVAGAFRVTLPNRHFDMATISDRVASGSSVDDIILQHLSKERAAPRKDLEAIIGLGTTRTTALLNDMIKRNLITKVGKGRFTKYALK